MSETNNTNILLIYNAHLVDETLNTPGAVLVAGDKIRAVYTGYFTNKKTLESMAEATLAEDGYKDCQINFHDAHGLTLMPAFIDMHTHLRYPGLTEKEDLQSGLSAAVAGGYGTVVAMPNTKPVVSDAEVALSIEAEAEKLGLANLIQSVSITKNFEGIDTSHLENLPREKIPLITEDGKDVIVPATMLDAMQTAGELGLVVSCHCEDASLSEIAKPLRNQALKLLKKYHINSWGAFSEEEEELLDDNPEAIEQIEFSLLDANELLATAENIATLRNIELAKLARCHIHIAHVSTAVAIDAVRRAKKNLMKKKNISSDLMLAAGYDAFEEYGEYDGPRFLKENEDAGIEAESVLMEIYDYIGNFNVTCEVTPHHLGLVGDSGRMLRAVVNPPIHGDEDRRALIKAIRDGTVDVISTDHAPHTAADKEAGSPGFVGLETSFAVCNSVLVESDQISLQKLSQLMSANAAKILQLNKGVVKAGYDADLVIVNCEEEWEVNSENFKSKGRATPFDGTVLLGKVKETFVNGRLVYSEV